MPFRCYPTRRPTELVGSIQVTIHLLFWIIQPKLVLKENASVSGLSFCSIIFNVSASNSIYHPVAVGDNSGLP